jgi:hypothetical protein
VIYGLFLLNALAAVPPGSPPPPTRFEAELQNWVQTRVGREESGGALYTPVLVDLNGDRATEALVYLSGRDRCGSGGCNLYILQRQLGAWRLVNSVTITNPPIRILSTRSRGWRDIAVLVRGGGVGPPYEAVLRFNGVRYPGNPTVAPAFRARPGTPGRTLISSDLESRPLFP